MRATNTLLPVPLRPWTPSARRARPLTSLAALLGLAALSSSEAQAQTSYAPIKPVSCGTTFTSVPFSRSTLEFPLDPNGCSDCYTNRLNQLTTSAGTFVIGNAWTSNIRFTVTFFQTEPNNFDFFEWGMPTGGFSAHPAGKLSGTFPAPFDIQIGPSISTFQQFPGLMTFFADGSVTASGVDLGTMQLCSSLSSPSSTTPNTLFGRAVGALLGNNDVIIQQVSTGTGIGNHQWLLLRGMGGTNDFDLAVKCGSPPTGPTDGQFLSRGGSSEEYLDLGAGCGFGVPAFVGVHSFSGSGTFELIVGEHKPTAHRTLTAGLNFVPTPAQTTMFRTQLQQGARFFFGATQGQQVIDAINFNTSGSCANCNGAACDICFENTAGTGLSPICYGAGPIRIRQGYFGSAKGLAHELGHKFFCGKDEYINRCASNVALACGGGCPGGVCRSWPQCGHSLMATVSDYNVNSMCDANDHKGDLEPGVPATSVANGVHLDAFVNLAATYLHPKMMNLDLSTHTFGPSSAVGLVTP